MEKILQLALEQEPTTVDESMSLADAVSYLAQDKTDENRAEEQTESANSRESDLKQSNGNEGKPSSTEIIVTKNDQPIGVLTVSRLLTAISKQINWEEFRISKLQFQPIFITKKTEITSIYSILSLFRRNQVQFLAVTDNKHKLIGVINKEKYFRILNSAPLMYELKSSIKVDNKLERIPDNIERELKQASNFKRTRRRRPIETLAKRNRLAPNSGRTSNSTRFQRKSWARNPRLISNKKFYLQQRRANLFADVALKIQQTLQLKEIISTAVNEVRRILNVERVLIYQIHKDGTGKVISEAVLDNYPPVLGITFPEEVFPSEYHDLYSDGRIKAISNINNPNLEIAECLVEFLAEWQVKAKVVVPILAGLAPLSPTEDRSIHSNQLWGVLIAHQCRSPRLWTEFELELMQDLANQIGIAIAQAQLLENLEEVVAVRTSELSRTNESLTREIKARIQIEEALRRSEEQLRSITDALPALIAYVDGQKYYQFNNKTYEKWFGHKTSDGKPSRMEDILGKQFYQKNYQKIETALSGKAITYESEIETISGKVRSVSVSYIPHIDRSGKVQGFFSLTSDISDRKAVERMKDEFLTLVSHELRTPLTSIHGSLTLLASGRLGTLSAKGQRMLEIADESTERLVRLVNNILDLQRMESGEVTMTKIPCQISELMVQSIEAMQSMAQQHQVTLINQPIEEHIIVDPDFMIQALTNLVANAIKFSKPHSTVFLSAKHFNNRSEEISAAPNRERIKYIQIEVKDEGAGIPSDQLESIFERFKQVDTSDSKKKGGTGLGLAICRKIIEQHGGKIWAESEMNAGSSFNFVLPISTTVNDHQTLTSHR